MDQIHQLPPLNALRAFHLAGLTLSFTRAAEALSVTQGAVAQQVRKLEEHLGVRLFERGARGLSFTDAGRAYHEEVSTAFEVLEAATVRLKPSPRKVTISVTPSFAAKWLIPNLRDFTANHPDIDLRILATEARSSFHSDGIDLSVRQGDPPFGASLRARKLFANLLVAVAAPGLDWPNNPSPDALAGQVLLHDPHGHWPRFLSDVLGVKPFPDQRGLRLSQTALCIDAALDGQGVALVPRFLVRRDLAAGRLVQVVQQGFLAPRDFYLLAPRTGRRPAAVQEVMDWLTSHPDAIGG